MNISRSTDKVSVRIM